MISAIEVFAIDRSRPQFMTEPSYLIFPLPYSLPGIGHGLLLTGLAGNIAETNIDVYALGITGDAEGMMIAVGDIHILPELLILNLSHQDISKAAVNNYDKRGMDSSADDYTLIGVNKVISDSAELTLSLFDRRFELTAAFYKQEAHIVNISDSKGNLIIDLTDPFISKSESRSLGFLVDYTDDRENPKEGVRFGAVYRQSPCSVRCRPRVLCHRQESIFLSSCYKTGYLGF